MKTNVDSLTERERTLSNALNVTVPPEVRVRLRDVIDTISDRTITPVRRNLRARLAISLATIAVVGVFAVVWQVGQDGHQDNVYAAVVKALEGVDTVHITGWTTRVEQRWQSSRDEDLKDGTRYPIDTWEWFTDEGGFRSYSKQGPIVIVVDGDRRYEYDTRYDHLSIWKHHASAEQGPRLRTIAQQFESMDQPGIVRRDLGETNIAADVVGGEPRRAYGLGWEKPNGRRGECWIDMESDLPITIDQYTTVDRRKTQWTHSEFAFDVPVPNEVLVYTVPDTANVDYDTDINPQFELWRSHLKEISDRYTDEPLPEGMALLARESDRVMEGTYPGRLPGITQETGIWVLPIQQTLQRFVDDNWTPKGSLEIVGNLGTLKLNHDLLTTNEHSGNDRTRFVVEALGLSLAERLDDRAVWVARYDRRPLKPWKEVKAPVPNPDNVPLRAGMRSTWGGEMSMPFLLEVLAKSRNSIVIDETGLSSTPVASEVPHWRDTPASDAIAKKWFEEQFGVVFIEQIRQVSTYEVKPN